MIWHKWVTTCREMKNQETGNRMKNLDLTKTCDIVEFAKKYHKYKDNVSLPKEVVQQIDLESNNYEQMMITSNELSNRIIDIIISFMASLK